MHVLQLSKLKSARPNLCVIFESQQCKLDKGVCSCMTSIAQNMKFRLSLLNYAAKYGVTKAAIRCKTNRHYILSLETTFWWLYLVFAWTFRTSSPSSQSALTRRNQANYGYAPAQSGCGLVVFRLKPCNDWRIFPVAVCGSLWRAQFLFFWGLQISVKGLPPQGL